MNQLNNNLIILCAFLFSLVIFSCNRDEPATLDKLTNQQTELRTVYCDGQITTGISLVGKYKDPITGKCCLTFSFDSNLNACLARLEESLVTQTISTPTSLYTPLVNNKVTFCGDFMPRHHFIIYYKECTGFGSGCQEFELDPDFKC